METTVTSSESLIASAMVEGAAVYSPAGDKLGAIDNLIIDKRSGQVQTVVLEVGGFLGLGSDRFPLPWHMLRYETVLDGYVVPLDKEGLKNFAGAPSLPDQPTPPGARYGQSLNKFRSN